MRARGVSIPKSGSVVPLCFFAVSLVLFVPVPYSFLLRIFIIGELPFPPWECVPFRLFSVGDDDVLLCNLVSV